MNLCLFFNYIVSLNNSSNQFNAANFIQSKVQFQLELSLAQFSPSLFYTFLALIQGASYWLCKVIIPKNLSITKSNTFFQITTYMEFLIFTFQKIPQSFSYYSSLKVYKCESMENTLNIKVFRKTISFCKYLHNGSSLDSNGPIHQFSWKSIHKNALKRCKRAHMFYRACVRSHRLYSDLYENLFIGQLLPNELKFQISWRSELLLRRYL